MTNAEDRTEARTVAINLDDFPTYSILLWRFLDIHERPVAGMAHVGSKRRAKRLVWEVLGRDIRHSDYPYGGVNPALMFRDHSEAARLCETVGLRFDIMCARGLDFQPT